MHLVWQMHLQVYIAALEVLLLFSDNFDYQVPSLLSSLPVHTQQLQIICAVMSITSKLAPLHGHSCF